MAKGEPESFAEMFAREEMPKTRARRLTVGEEVEGIVAHISADSVLVDLDAKQQGFFDRQELLGTDGELRVKVGETIKGRVLAMDGDDVKLGVAFGREAGREQLRIALDQGVAVEGKVVAINKGGVEVEIAGVRGFCPMSQLDARYVEDPNTFLGQVLRFEVTQLKDRDVVLSRRKVLQREAGEAREKIRETLTEGTILKGRVTQIREFGAFVDLGGIEGLIPMRELSHDRVQRADDVLTVGDGVEVKILRVEPEGERLKITLSLRALASDPWESLAAVAPMGHVVAGQITRLQDFGAFVRLAPGIEGLLHVSELGARVTHPSEQLEVGQQLMVVVREVDPVRHRISLTLADQGAQQGQKAVAMRAVMGAVVNAKVEKHERFGVFVQVEGTQGRAGRGLIPNADLNLRAGADPRKDLPIGSDVRAKVVDATEGRMRLSVRAAFEDAERADFDNYREAHASKGKMGTFGDLLKDKLGK